MLVHQGEILYELISLFEISKNLRKYLTGLYMSYHLMFERVVALTEIISMLALACLLHWVMQFVQQFLLQPGLNHMGDVQSYLHWLGLLLRLNLRREVRTTGNFCFSNFNVW
jgi:hypothetical protein